MTIVIVAKHDGFRRCGVAHSSKKTKYPDDFFTEEQLLALSKEPQLILGYEDDEPGPGDQLDGNRSEALPPQASSAQEDGQSQAPQAIVAPLGGVVELPAVPAVSLIPSDQLSGLENAASVLDGQSSSGDSGATQVLDGAPGPVVDQPQAEGEQSKTRKARGAAK